MDIAFVGACDSWPKHPKTNCSRGMKRKRIRQWLQKWDMMCSVKLPKKNWSPSSMRLGRSMKDFGKTLHGCNRQTKRVRAGSSPMQVNQTRRNQCVSLRGV